MRRAWYSHVRVDILTGRVFYLVHLGQSNRRPILAMVLLPSEKDQEYPYFLYPVMLGVKKKVINNRLLSLQIIQPINCSNSFLRGTTCFGMWNKGVKINTVCGIYCCQKKYGYGKKSKKGKN